MLAAADGLSNTAIADKLDIHVSSARKWRRRFWRTGSTGWSTSRARAGRGRGRRADRGVDHRDAGERAHRRHALVDPVDGRAPGDVAVDGVAGVAGLRAGPAQDRIPGSCRRTRSSSTRSATSSGSTSTRPNGRWCSAWTRRPRSRRSTAPHRCSRCCPAPRRGPATTTSATAPRASTPRSTWPPARSSARCMHATARPSSGVPPQDRRRGPRRPRRATWCSTTPRPTRPRRSSAGWPAHPRFVLHFTPTSSSWLNLVERWFAELTTKKLRRGTHTSVRQLNADIRAWIKPGTTTPSPTSGPRPPTKSSPASATTANELTTQDTSSSPSLSPSLRADRASRRIRDL